MISRRVGFATICSGFVRDGGRCPPYGRRPIPAATARSEALEVGDEVVQLLLRQLAEAGDLLRAVARPVGEDDHLVVGEVRDRVDRRRPDGPPSPASEREIDGDDDDTIAKREFDEAKMQWDTERDELTLKIHTLETELQRTSEMLRAEVFQELKGQYDIKLTAANRDRQEIEQALRTAKRLQI